MTTREFDPRRLDVPAFAKTAAELHGRWPLKQLHRVAQSAAAEAPVADADEVVWSARGDSRLVRGGEAQPSLHLQAHGSLSLVCQRCLGAMAVDLVVDRRFVFVHGEDAAAQLDEESEDDVLAVTRALDLLELTEEELLLAMPLVPRHEVCPVPLPAPEGALDDEASVNPFAALAALKRDSRPN